MYHNPILLKVISVVLHDILKGLRHCIKKKVSTMTLDNCSTTGHHPRILALPEVVSQTELEAVAAHGGVFPVPIPA
ncbi:hypothetical protein BDA96_05G132000 [Sorghum bicolor]|uniref:Uncharacterized protein n=2 Tax=Sorghum bicolor TaxID=4558 RepID=A0A921QWT6_SORBI|nr:hypothetical protein BDA96_05G132000 [Sorghum bicolor]OQU83452.1 hypothetical protein SORBI_3005G118900 [Sorghum bicolor]